MFTFTFKKISFCFAIVNSLKCTFQLFFSSESFVSSQLLLFSSPSHCCRMEVILLFFFLSFFNTLLPFWVSKHQSISQLGVLFFSISVKLYSYGRSYSWSVCVLAYRVNVIYPYHILLMFTNMHYIYITSILFIFYYNQDFDFIQNNFCKFNGSNFNIRIIL